MFPNDGIVIIFWFRIQSQVLSHHYTIRARILAKHHCANCAAQLKKVYKKPAWCGLMTEFHYEVRRDPEEVRTHTSHV